MENSVNELQAHFQSLTVPIPPQNVNFQELASEQIRQLAPGLDPTQTQLATVLAALQIKTEHEARLSRHLLHKTLLDTVNTVSTNKQDITQLKVSVDKTEQSCSQLQFNQGQTYTQLGQVHNLSWKAYNMAAETKQKSSKGSFIVSGEGVPRFYPNEDLFALLFPLIYKKYGISVQISELKALHRLPNNKVFFSLLTRLPDQSFDQLTRAMNSNPKPEIRLYVSIQLFEPYAELYYVSRRLKFYKTISNYRLDENGFSWISLKLGSMSFKFTGLEQLDALQVPIPPQVKQEIEYRRAQIKENEDKSWNLNNEKAFKDRPNYPPNPPQPHSHMQNSVSPHHGQTNHPRSQGHMPSHQNVKSSHQGHPGPGPAHHLPPGPSHPMTNQTYQQLHGHPAPTHGLQASGQSYPTPPAQGQLNPTHGPNTGQGHPTPLDLSARTPPNQYQYLPASTQGQPTHPQSIPASGPPPSAQVRPQAPPMPRPSGQPQGVAPPGKKLRYDPAPPPPLHGHQQYRHSPPNPVYPGQSPPYPPPESFFSTPPPGEQMTGNMSGQFPYTGTGSSYSSRIFQHSDPSTHAVIEEMNYEQL